MVIRIRITPESEQVVAQRAQRPRRVAANLSKALLQVAHEAATVTQTEMFEPWSGGGTVTKLGVLRMRSRALRNDIDAGKSSQFVAWFGVPAGRPATKYAWLLGDEDHVMVPKNANHLWIPTPANLNASGVVKMTPREAMSVRGPRGGRWLRIFKSKAGNLVAFLPGKTVTDKAGERLGLVKNKMGVGTGRHKKGTMRGLLKGIVLFVLRKSVRVESRHTLTTVAKRIEPRAQTLFAQALADRMEGTR